MSIVRTPHWVVLMIVVYLVPVPDDVIYLVPVADDVIYLVPVPDDVIYLVPVAYDVHVGVPVAVGSHLQQLLCVSPVTTPVEDTRVQLAADYYRMARL